MQKVRVRYAPSPTGLLHIGNARSALFNYLFARHHQGSFIIRIEDTDVSRNVEGGELSQLHYLAWLGITWDEGPDKGGDYGPYNQLSRLEVYQRYAQDLLDKGLAYKDYRENSDKYAIRFKVPQNITYQFDDMVRGTLKFESKEVEDWIIVKDNGIPTYNFAVVIDDYYMKISHVLRGEEHITNTPKQLMIYNAFGWQAPTFGHMTIIVNEHKKKLSKRDLDVVQFIGEYDALGYLPEAMLNFIALLGWSPTANEEILSKEQLVELFDEAKLSKAPAMFDKQKLAYINSKYIKMLDIEGLKKLCVPFIQKANIEVLSNVWLERLLLLFQDRLTHGAQIVTLYQNFFHEDFNISEEVFPLLTQHPSLVVLETVIEMLDTTDFNDPVNIEQAVKQVAATTGIKGKSLFMPLRIATTAEAHGPSLPISLYLLGKEKVLSRLTKTIELLKGVS